jgi:RNA-directed DNA polymerase
MKESYGEGVASHTDPESCAERCEARGEALTGARAGRVIEPRKGDPVIRRVLPGADALSPSGKPYVASRQCETRRDSARSKNQCMRGNLVRGNREVLWSSADATADRVGKSKDVRR